MNRIAALILCILAALVTFATPAPQPRPWFTGWDKPVDPKGDCRFERDGEQLTITVPGKDHADHADGETNAPRLLRVVEGDFVVEARVSGDCWSFKQGGGGRGAGILVRSEEKDTVMLELRGLSCEEEPRVSSDNWLSLSVPIRIPADTGARQHSNDNYFSRLGVGAGAVAGGGDRSRPDAGGFAADRSHAIAVLPSAVAARLCRAFLACSAR